MNSLWIKTALVITLFMTSLALTAKAEEDILSSPEDQARRAHDLSQSDVMYQQEDFRALYYQNLEIIALLKEIRDEMHNLNVRDAKKQ